MAKHIENMDKTQLLAEISKQEKNLANMDEETPERRTCEYSLRRLRKALSFVGDSGLTFRQTLERRISEVEITRKWERDSMDGQYGRITLFFRRESRDIFSVADESPSPVFGCRCSVPPCLRCFFPRFRNSIQ